MTDERIEAFIAEAKRISHSDWREIASAPFRFRVNWAGIMVGEEGQRATGWLLGGLLGATATVNLEASIDNGRLVDKAVRPDGEVLPEFLKTSSLSNLEHVAKALHTTEARARATRQRLHNVYTGLYHALHEANATKPCYLQFARAQLRMDDALSRLAQAVLSSRVAVEAQFKLTSEREAADRRDEALAWAASHVEQCQKAEKATDCDGIDAYLAKYPTGLHVAEAKAALASVQDAITRLRDDAAWVAADIPRCKSPEKSDACDGVEQYLKQRPNGLHAVEARELLRLKRFALAQLAVNEDNERRMVAIRKQRACLDGCVKALRRCQSACRAGDPSALMTCQRSCAAGYNDTCAPGCKP
ncbi:MAG: hypothetical protein MUF54_07880 [Polyangiaceae bacterium]|jgi:hypothetical protein|nr:hypothetical protein [Polyangiaceae bacterium]